MCEYPLDWSISNLGAYIQETKERAGDSDATPYSVSKVLGIVPQSEKFNKRVASSDISSYKVIREGDFAYDPMLLWDGSINRMLRDEIGAVSPAYVTFKVSSGSLDADYLLHFLKANTTKNFYKSISKGTNVRRQKAEFADFAAGEFAFPPLPEQKKIAEILSGIDKVIEAKKKELQKSEFILKAIKEDLISNSADWHQCELGELLSFRNGLNTEKDNFGIGVPFVGYKDVYSGGVITAKCLNQKVSLPAVEEERFCLRTGDILFTRTSETPDEIGFSCVFDDQDGGAVFNGFSIRGRPIHEEKLMPEFSSFYFMSEPVLSQMRFLCKYTTRAGISAESLSKVKVRIPDLNTQSRISDSLVSLKNLRLKVEGAIRNLQNLKQSLSADLLSGRKRVSV